LGSKRGGRREPWDEKLRQRAMARAEVVGADVAGAECGIPAGTIRSWARRAKLRAERDAYSDDLLEQVRAEGAAIVRAREGRSAEERTAAREAAERVRLATIRWLDSSAGSEGRAAAEIELTEAKIARLELEEELNRKR
jgi:hypothetical protein